MPEYFLYGAAALAAIVVVLLIATHTAEFAFKPDGNQTAVTWTMLGNNNFMLKAMGLFMNRDKMIGRDFEKGLASMKSGVEAKQ